MNASAFAVSVGPTASSLHPSAIQPSCTSAPEVPGVPTAQDDSDRIPVAGAPALGPDTAPVTMVQFSDFQCPPCAEADGTVRQLRERYGDRLRVVWRNNPLAMHANAMIASAAFRSLSNAPEPVGAPASISQKGSLR